MQRKENGRKKEAETQIRRSPQKERERERPSFSCVFFLAERRRQNDDEDDDDAPLDIFESSFALCSFSTLSFGCARRGRTIGRQTYFICISLICVIFVRSDYSCSFLLLFAPFPLACRCVGPLRGLLLSCAKAPPSVLKRGPSSACFFGPEVPIHFGPKKKEREDTSLFIFILLIARSAHSFIHKKEEQ